MARPKPALASWIVRERKRLGLKPADVVARLGAQGVTVSEQTVRVWESNAGRNPSAFNIEALERIFGSQAPGKVEPDQTDLAAAIRELTDELRAMRQEREAMDIRVAALEALVALRAPSSGEGSPAREAPPVEAGSGR